MSFEELNHIRNLHAKFTNTFGRPPNTLLMPELFSTTKVVLISGDLAVDTQWKEVNAFLGMSVEFYKGTKIKVAYVN